MQNYLVAADQSTAPRGLAELVHSCDARHEQDRGVNQLRRLLCDF